MGNTMYFLSDTHFGHKNILKFERTQFETVEEHDNFLLDMYNKLANRVKPGDTVYHLGDFGNPIYGYANSWLRDAGAKTVLVRGNHDSEANMDVLKMYFDQVFMYPTFISNRVMISHRPYLLAEPGVLNVHGHLHGSRLDSPNYLCCSVDVINYTPVTDKYIADKVGKLPQYQTKFLKESYAHLYKFEKSRNKDDIIVDYDGRIDLPATLAYQKLLDKLGNESPNG